MKCIRFASAGSIFFLPILVLSLLSQVSAAEDGPGTSCGEASWHWTPKEWTYSETDHDTKDFAARPDEATVNAIVVEWQEPKRDALGNFCIIGGQLTVPGENNAGNRPVDWLQGITVYMATTPDQKPDWSRGMNQADTVHSNAVLKQSGKFQLRIDLRKATQDRKLARTYQFGIALARHIDSTDTRQKIVWNSRAPAIPATIAMLHIPAAAELSHAIGLVNHASGWPFRNPDGTDLIRAVNALQQLGKDKAIAELEKYIELTSGPDYHSESEIVFWIARVLFPPEPGELLQRPAIGVFLDDRDAADSDKWPLNPMAVVNDIPFMLGHQISTSGRPAHPSSVIKFAKNHGILREKALAPTTDPLTAAEFLFADDKFKVLDEYSRKEATRLIRSQALTMAGIALQKGFLGPVSFYDELDDRNWKAVIAKTARRQISWDKKLEQFVKPQ